MFGLPSPSLTLSISPIPFLYQAHLMFLWQLALRYFFFS
ncbi:putative membrane protein [Streptococcus pneumoniae GA17457]|nr:putative membrane protein [Streptococcus pneumoniae GA17457]